MLRQVFKRSQTLFHAPKYEHNALLLEAQALASQRAAAQGIKLKPTTGLVGVPVQPKWRQIMLKLIDDVISELDTRIPKNTAYRVFTENNFKFFRRVVEENDDYEVVEDTINRGQVEELIMMFEDELTLIPLMEQWKPWHVTEESVKLEKKYFDNIKSDPMLPEDFKYPYDQFKYNTWSGIYQVEYTEEELAAMEEAKQAEADAAAAASSSSATSTKKP